MIIVYLNPFVLK